MDTIFFLIKKLYLVSFTIFTLLLLGGLTGMYFAYELFWSFAFAIVGSFGLGCTVLFTGIYNEIKDHQAQNLKQGFYMSNLTLSLMINFSFFLIVGGLWFGYSGPYSDAGLIAFSSGTILMAGTTMVYAHSENVIEDQSKD